MDRVEHLLREEFERSGRGPVPPAGAMLARVARARRRRTAVTAAVVATTVAAAVGVATAVSGVGDPRGQEDPAGDPPEVGSVSLLNVVSTDRDHGYVLQQSCVTIRTDPTGVSEAACRPHLLATTDAGRTWRARPLPAGAGSESATPTHDGHAPVLWVDGAGALAVGGANRRYWTTTDGGATWRESPTPSVAGSIVTVGPGDTLTPLATRPPLPDPVPNPRTPLVPAADGSYWVECVEAECVLVTRDRGQTWQTVPVDAGARVQWLATADGRTVYAGGGSAVVRSVDGGATWTALAGSEHLPELGYVGLALPGGDLLVGTYQGLYRFPAGAGTAERVPGTPTRVNTLYRTGGWLVAAPVWDSAGEGSTASVSPDDGQTWVRVPLDA